jgi:hypothetical protein
LGFGVWALGVGAIARVLVGVAYQDNVQCSVFSFRVHGSRFKIQGSGFRVSGLGFRFWSLGFRFGGLRTGVYLGASMKILGFLMLCPALRSLRV